MFIIFNVCSVHCICYKMSYTVFAGQDVGRKFYDNSYQHFGHANVFTSDRQSYRAPARPIHYGGARQPVSVS